MKWGQQSADAFRYSLRCGSVRLGIGTALISGLTLLAIATAWWWPAQHERARLQQDIDVKRAALMNVARLSQVEQAQREALLSVALLEEKLGVQAGQADLVRGIARLAAARKVRVTSQSFDEGRAQRGDEVPLFMELGLLGNYSALRGMIADLATLPMWMEVVDARLEHGSENGAPVKAQLRLLTFRNAKGQS